MTGFRVEFGVFTMGYDVIIVKFAVLNTVFLESAGYFVLAVIAAVRFLGIGYFLLASCNLCAAIG